MQIVRLGNIIHAGSRRAHAVDNARAGVHLDLRLTKKPLVALPSLIISGPCIPVRFLVEDGASMKVAPTMVPS